MFWKAQARSYNRLKIFRRRSVCVVDWAARQNGGVLNAAISSLLAMPPDVPEAPARPFAPAPSPRWSAISPLRPLQRPSSPGEHIFPPDFLRQPGYVEWIRVSCDPGGGSQLQTDGDAMPSIGQRDRSPALQMKRCSWNLLSQETEQSGWGKLKSKLRGTSSS